MAEQVLAGSQKYHKRCFTCNNKPTCNKSLGGGAFNEHAGNYRGVIKQLLDEVIPVLSAEAEGCQADNTDTRF